MEFFQIQQDRRYKPIPVIPGIISIVPPTDARKRNFHKFERYNGVKVSSNPENQYTDILDFQLFLISEPVKHVFDLYARDIDYLHFCLLDNPNDFYKYYYLPLFEEIDCLHEASEHNPGKSVFQTIVLRRQLVDHRHIFMVSEIGARVIIISLQVAESLLRRGLTGIKLTPVSLC